MLKINIDMDQVEIEGQVVKRPNWITRYRWDRFWHDLKSSYATDRCPQCKSLIHGLGWEKPIRLI